MLQASVDLTRHHITSLRATRSTMIIANVSIIALESRKKLNQTQKRTERAVPSQFMSLFLQSCVILYHEWDTKVKSTSKDTKRNTNPYVVPE